MNSTIHQVLSSCLFLLHKKMFIRLVCCLFCLLSVFRGCCLLNEVNAAEQFSYSWLSVSGDQVCCRC